MTLSNLHGVPYSVPFDGGTEPKNGGKDYNGRRENCYHMISHGDRVFVAVFRLVIRFDFGPETFGRLVIKTGGGQIPCLSVGQDAPRAVTPRNDRR